MTQEQYEKIHKSKARFDGHNPICDLCDWHDSEYHKRALKNGISAKEADRQMKAYYKRGDNKTLSYVEGLLHFRKALKDAQDKAMRETIEFIERDKAGMAEMGMSFQHRDSWEDLPDYDSMKRIIELQIWLTQEEAVCRYWGYAHEETGKVCDGSVEMLERIEKGERLYTDEEIDQIMKGEL